MLKRYSQFEMKTKQAKAFEGNIYQIRDPHTLIDIPSHLKPGQISIFCINKLSTREIDTFVTNTIQQVFRANLPESPTLKTLSLIHI